MTYTDNSVRPQNSYFRRPLPNAKQLRGKPYHSGTADKRALQEKYKECGMGLGKGVLRTLGRGKVEEKAGSESWRIKVCGSWFYFSFLRKILSVSNYALVLTPSKIVLNPHRQEMPFPECKALPLSLWRIHRLEREENWRFKPSPLGSCSL